ncbi:hypothetical protein D3C86_554660 [compost metagenome]
MFFADAHARHEFFQGRRHHDADRHLPVVGRVGRVHGAMPVIEPDGRTQLAHQRLVDCCDCFVAGHA